MGRDRASGRHPFACTASSSSVLPDARGVLPRARSCFHPFLLTACLLCHRLAHKRLMSNVEEHQRGPGRLLVPFCSFSSKHWVSGCGLNTYDAATLLKLRTSMSSLTWMVDGTRTPSMPRLGVPASHARKMQPLSTSTAKHVGPSTKTLAVSAALQSKVW